MSHAIFETRLHQKIDLLFIWNWNLNAEFDMLLAKCGNSIE